MNFFKNLGLEERVQGTTLMIASVATGVMHYVNTTKGVVTPIGVYMNPTLAVLMSVCALIIVFRDRWANCARNVAYFAIAIYLLVIYGTSMHVFHNKHTLLTISNFMPVGLYVMSYLLVPRRSTTYSIIAYSMLLAITLPNFHNLSDEVRYFTTSLMLSHPIFISGAHFAARLKSDHIKMRMEARKLRSQINKDALTQLASRNPVYAEFAQDANMIRTTEGGTDDVTVYMIDLDHFKRVNDTLGHGVGDRVLVEVSRALQSATRPTDLVARWGGEEFVVVARGVGSFDVANEVGHRIQAAINKVHPGGGLPNMSASIGIATRSGYEKLQDLLEYADAKAYAAKRAGRNQQVHWDQKEVIPTQGNRIESFDHNI